MLNFVKRSFKVYISVLLWFILIANIVLGIGLGVTLIATDDDFIFLGILSIIFGIIIGLVTCVIVGGVIVTFLKIEEHLEVLRNQTTGSTSTTNTNRPVNTNTSRSTTSASPNTPNVARNPQRAGADSKVGTIGPGGGYIFFDKGVLTDGWRYLEAAPAISELRGAWGLNGIVCPGTKTAIGTGKENTMAIITLLNANGETDKAAQLCASLNINGYNDWFLPSKDELNEMFLQLRVEDNLGEFKTSGAWPHGLYWSSSALDDTHTQATWYQRLKDDGYQNYYSDSSHIDRKFELDIRAIRAF